MSRYLLAPHVYSCLVEGHAIFFDLKSDQFSALDSSNVALLQSAVEGWPGGSGAAPVAGNEIDAAACLMDLVDQGLLTEGSADGHPAARAFVTPARRDTRNARAATRPAGSRGFLRFIVAWTEMWWMTRFWSVERIVAHVRATRAAAQSNPQEVDEDGYLSALQDFRRCQRAARWLRVGDGIREAVCLIQFMFRLGLYPTWVFGVRLKPFAARSWIQVGDLALNIPAESARQFTPILVV